MDLRKLCRFCFVDDITVDITEHQASVRSLDESNPELEQQQTVLQILHTMFGNSKHISLDLAEDLPMMCNSCLEECLLHYAYFRKLVLANRQIHQFYAEAQQEQSLLKDAANSPEPTAADINSCDLNEEMLQTKDFAICLETKASQRLANEDSLIVSEFLPSTQLDELAELDTNPAQFLPHELRTVDYAAVELKHNDLDEYIEANRQLDIESSGFQAVFKCKYCPRAYASPQFLKTHVRKSHVCKYCTTAFAKVQDLNQHIRSKHQNHTCVICCNSFSNSSNLRNHLKRVHDVQLPAGVALLDYRPANEAAASAQLFTNLIDESE